MKKFQKMCALLAALALGLICFAGCSNDAGGSSVVAQYQDTDLGPYIYIFYSDGTYEYKESQIIMRKGKYNGDPTKRGSMTMQQQDSIDPISGKLISNPKTYFIVIDKDEKGDLVFEDDEGYTYFLN